MSQVHRVVQISDLHLLKLRYERNVGFPPAITFQAILDDIKSLSPKPEKLILTGDISDASFVESYFLIERMLMPMETPYVWIPGNHDDVTLMSLMESQLSVEKAKQFILGERNFILLNSVIPDELEGKLSRDSLEFLDRSLQTYAELPAWVFLHHHPLMIHPRLEGLMLTNSEDFFYVLDKHSQVEGVFFGHVHITYQEERNGVKYFACPPSVFPYDEVNSKTKHMIPGYHVLDWTEGEGWTCEARHLDIATMLKSVSFFG